jgi:hypothetical protein
MNKTKLSIDFNINKIDNYFTIMKDRQDEREAATPPRDWIQTLDEEDRAFVKRFILASGSLKELASAYGISYPTVRLRLDRLIAKIKIFEDHRFTTEFERLVRARYAEGRLDKDMLRELLEAHRMEVSNERAE